MFAFFERRRKRGRAAQGLYGAIVAQARRSCFYTDMNVPDTIDGRYELILVHAFLVCDRLRREGREGALLSQGLFDALFRDMDRALREAGVGDLAVPHHVKRMMKGFNGRCAVYSEALEDHDFPLRMRDVLARNLYGTVGRPDDALLDKVAAYVQRARDGLSGQKFNAICAGEVVFPADEALTDINIGRQAENNDGYQAESNTRVAA